MTENLFRRINDESAIQIVPSEDSCQPGYCWKWEDATSGVFESQEAALISAINCLNDSYKTVVTMNDEATISNRKLRLEVTNRKIRSSLCLWLEELDKEFVVMMFLAAVTLVGLFGLAFLELFLASRGISIKR
jgi:hypothetical protein